ncbi:uncharacterized protein JN550_003783 [Neoarthrinium moseri]|uniref:uncharacterized protein n=1 Tax=Neoarthrinium moseri TaxID=1658444 RepID=UPI001FDBA284|nr:uncharacterized protein JN550_003783 [Neoarthrinium moseri]KAI1872909.1 hypothetical protein JN550_003783 [Neoarthrinium moseri]
MSSSFSVLPSNAQQQPKPFELKVPEQEIEKFRTLLSLSEIGSDTWWSQPSNGYFGVTRQWLMQAKDEWLRFDWRKTENRVNAFPNFKVDITSGGQHHKVHFAALFSSKADAFPVIFLHGWPGSFLEFLPMLELLAEKYTPATLPWHVIVPSIPDYGLTTRDDHQQEMRFSQAAGIMNELMVQLGFKSGYAAQGGDVGSGIATTMASMFPECVAYHLNLPFKNMVPTDLPLDLLTVDERAQMERSAEWMKTGMAYAFEQGTRPATIGLVLSSNPLAMLAWIGEKYLEWADHRQPLSLETILAMISFYWFTKSYSKSVWPYRELGNSVPQPGASFDQETVDLKAHNDATRKPLGYSAFPKEILVIPQSWAQKTFPNLVFYRRHSIGGHFAALEQPQAFLEDVEEFMQIVSAK